MQKLRGNFILFVVALVVKLTDGYRLGRYFQGKSTSTIRFTKGLLSATVSDKSVNELIYEKSAFENGHSDCLAETCEVIGNDLPSDLEGTYYKNCQGKFTVGEETIMHPFDADGLVVGISIKDGKALFRNRLVRTKGFLLDREKGKIAMRGFGTDPTNFFKRIFNTNIKNCANTNAIYWGNKVLALNEGGNPYILEPDTLTTIGESQLNGVLKKGQPFSAHPRVDPKTKRLINFSTVQGGKTCDLSIFEFNSDLSLAKQRSEKLPDFAFMHDFAVTENYYVFTQCPVGFNPLPFILGQQPAGTCITYESEKPALIHIIPRDSSKPMKTVEVEPHFNFHFANAYEDETGNILLDVIRSDTMVLKPKEFDRPVWVDFDYANEAPLTKLHRYTLALKEGTEEWENKGCELLLDLHFDFPVVNPNNVCQKYRYLYGNCGGNLKTSSPLQGVFKLDLETKESQKWLPEKGQFLGEVMFAHKKNSKGNVEDDGYIVSLLLDGTNKSSEFVVFDAKDIAEGPISRTPLPTMIPFGFHGCFVPDLNFNNDEVTSKFKDLSNSGY